MVKLSGTINITEKDMATYTNNLTNNFNDADSNVGTQKPITFKALINTAVRYWHILIPIVLICFIIAIIYSSFIVTPMYKSTAKLYIINKASEQVTSSDISISTYLTKDFAAILGDEVVLSEVAEDLKGKYSVSTLKSFLKIEATENTRIIEINVLSPNAKDSKKIADSVCSIAEEKLVDIMGLDRVRVIRNGSVAKSPSSPNVTADAIKGFIVGFALAVATAFVILFTDNKISSEVDVEKILGLNVLTSIPFNQSKIRSK